MWREKERASAAPRRAPWSYCLGNQRLALLHRSQFFVADLRPGFQIILVDAEVPQVEVRTGDVSRRQNSCQHRVVLIVIAMHPISPNELKIGHRCQEIAG